MTKKFDRCSTKDALIARNSILLKAFEDKTKMLAKFMFLCVVSENVSKTETMKHLVRGAFAFIFKSRGM